MTGYILKNAKKTDAFLRLFADADFAGCKRTARSTSGAFASLSGPGIFVPLSGKTAKQSCVSHSTPEAELVSADTALRCIGLPFMDLFDVVLNRPVELVFEEDNQTAILTMKKGQSQQMRHMNRTHRVSLRWLHEVLCQPGVTINYCDTKEMAADIFTKFFPNAKAETWLKACEMLGMGPPMTSKL